MSEQKEPEITLREDGFYEIKLIYPKDRLKDLIGDGYGREYNVQRLVVEKFAEVYVERHFDELVKLIDLETVKLLATRKLVNVVANG